MLFLNLDYTPNCPTMKTLAKYSTILFAALCLNGCSPGEFIHKTVRPREDIRQVTFSVPAIGSQDCRSLLLKVLDPFQATGVVTGADLNPDQGTLVVTFKSRELAIKNLEYAIAKAGFDIEDTPGNPKAKANLPEACR